MAAWFHTKDSLSKTLITIGIAVVLTTLISSCQSAPVVNSAAATIDPWWHNSCSATHMIRHQRSVKKHKYPPIGRLETAIKNVITNFNNTMKHGFASMYNISWEKQHINESQFQDRLPVGPELQKIKGTDPLQVARFHTDTQKYAMELERLINLEIESDISASTNRQDVLNKTRDRMKTMLCELETFLNRTTRGMEALEWLTVSEDWLQSKDLTETLVLDLRFVQMYERFLKDWSRVVKEMVAVSSKKQDGTGGKGGTNKEANKRKNGRNRKGNKNKNKSETPNKSNVGKKQAKNRNGNGARRPTSRVRTTTRSSAGRRPTNAPRKQPKRPPNRPTKQTE